MPLSYSLDLSKVYGFKLCIFVRLKIFLYKKTHLWLNYLWKDTLFDFFFPNFFSMLHVHLPCIGEEEKEMRNKVSLDLDIHVVIFVMDLNMRKEPKGRLERKRVLNEMNNILSDASTLNLPNCMSIFVYLYP